MSAAVQELRERVRAKNMAAQRGAPVLAHAPTLAVTPYDRFRLRYRDEPAAFVRDCLQWRNGESPSDYQFELVGQLPLRRRVAVRGPHGLGKSALASWLILWFALTRDGEDWKCPTTASAWRQLTKYLWPEVHKWARRLRWDVIGRQPFDQRSELLQLNLKLKTGEAFALASDNHETIEGAHADHLLYVFDEAKAIPAATFDAAEGAFMGAAQTETLALAISTPGEPQGRFYDIHRRKPGYEDWWVRHVSLAETIAAGRANREVADQRRRQWGEQSALYQNRVEGEFCPSDAEGVIPLAWVEMAQERFRVLAEERAARPPFKCVGVDVGGGGGRDNTTFAPRYGNVITELRRNNNEDTMQTTGRVVGMLEGLGGYAMVDVIGLGAGVVSRGREQGYDVRAFNASEATQFRDISGEMGFANKRAAAWWNLREMLDPANGHDVALPPDDELTSDLTAPHKKPESGGRMRMESKDEIRVRLGRSTDVGDAVVQAFWAGEPSNPFFWA
jgi:hypothetical protein